MIRFFVALLLEIFILVMRHPMYASVVFSHGHPSINGCPSSLLLGLITKKSYGYSQESTEIAMYCNVPTGLTTNLSPNSNIIEVVSKEVIPMTLQVLMVRILMAAPKSTSVFGRKHPFYLNCYHWIPWVCILDRLLLA
jgi:hypothetical protein